MPSIHKVTIAGDLARWRVRYRLPGESKLRSKTFQTRKEASVFSAELRSMQARGAFVAPNAGNDSGHEKLPGDGHEAARWRT